MSNDRSIYERYIMTDYLYHEVLHFENPKAFEKLKKEAREQNPWAVVRLAELAIEGKYVYHDVEDPIEYGIRILLPLANQGFSFAQYKLAETYLKTKQKDQAIELLKECLKARIPDAAHMLAQIYSHKPKKAKKYRKLALKWGFAEQDVMESSDIETQVTYTKQTDSKLIQNESNSSSLELDEYKPSLSWLQSGKKKKVSGVKVYKRKVSGK